MRQITCLCWTVLCWAAVWVAAVTPRVYAQADALNQAPQRVQSAQEAKAPGLSHVPAVELTQKVAEIDVLPYAQYWVDNDKNTTPSEVEARASAGLDLFKSSNASQKHMVHGKVLWMRFAVRTIDTRSRWWLKINAPLIDDVQLFWRDTNNQWISLKAGDTVSRERWPVHSRAPVFALHSDAQASEMYYLRIENARVPVSVPLAIYRDSRFIEYSQASNLLIGCLLGLLLAILCATALLALQTRDKVFSAYTVYLLIVSSYIVTTMGIAPQYLWSDSPRLADRMNYVLACLVSATLPSLVRIILQPVIRKRLFDSALSVVIVLMLVVAGFEAFAPSVLSYRVMNAGAFASFLLLGAQVLAAWQRGTFVTRWIAVCFMPTFLAAIPLIMRNLGMIPNGWYTQYATIFAIAISAPFLFYGLILRSAQRREANARAAGLPRQDALTGLPDMRSFLEVMHGSQIRAHRFKQRFGVILIDLYNHDWFVKEQGQEMAERALVLMSTRLQKHLRDVDNISRIDKHQFAILLEGPCTVTQLSKFSAQISAEGHRPSESLPVGASLKFLLTCCLLPRQNTAHGGEDAQDVLAWLINTAEAIPVETHKMVRMIDL